MTLKTQKRPVPTHFSDLKQQMVADLHEEIAVGLPGPATRHIFDAVLAILDKRLGLKIEQVAAWEHQGIDDPPEPAMPAPGGFIATIDDVNWFPYDAIRPGFRLKITRYGLHVRSNVVAIISKAR